MSTNTEKSNDLSYLFLIPVSEYSEFGMIKECSDKNAPTLDTIISNLEIQKG